MKKLKTEQYGVSSWYSTLADYTFPTTFVKLKDAELDLLAHSITDESEVFNIVNRISKAQGAFSGNTFVFGDTTAPTDTERFAFKKGAVYSSFFCVTSRLIVYVAIAIVDPNSLAVSV